MDLVFKVATELVKAEEADGKYLISGVCSTSEKDLQNDVISSEALQEMSKSAPGVPIVQKHSSELLDELGKVTESHYADNKLYITAELDSEDPLAKRAYNKIKKSGKMQFSIGASVTKLMKNIDSSVRMTVGSCRLNHIALTSQAVNKGTNCFAVSLAKALEDKQMDPEVITTEVPVVPETTPVIEKAGKKFSSDTVGVLKQIYAAGGDNVKTMVKGMFDAGDPDGDDVCSSTPQDGDVKETIGLINKSEVTELIKSGFAEVVPNIVKEIKIELAKANITSPVSQNSFTLQQTISKALDSNHDIGAILRAAIS